MSEARNLSRLWRFFDDSLRSHTESQVLSKQKESDILLALSQVFRRVELWNQEDDSDSDTCSVTRLDCESELSAHFRSNLEEIDCLSKIIFDLVYLLTFDSRYIQHLTGNVLLAISEFVIENESYWEAFIRLLCVCLDLGVNTLLTCSLTTSLLGTQDSNNNLFLALKDKLKNGNWSVVNGLVRVLRCVLKNSTQNNDTQIMSMYFDSINSCLSNLPWNSFEEIFFGVMEKKAQNESFERFVFLGNFIQFLCSLVVNNHRALSLIIVLVPKLLHWCLGNQGDCVNKCTHQYFRHKLLVLMIRLGSQTSQDYSVLISWLELLKQYFSEDLQRPIKSRKPVLQNESLEGSPFLSCFYDEEVNSSSSIHVQRRVIFLYLRCSFGLINFESDPNEKCACVTRNDATEELECCARKRGLIELNKWLRRHFSTDVFSSDVTYYQKCKDFTFDFLKLYMHEDDLLFRMLLLLLCLPIPARKESEKDNVAFQDAKFDVLFHVSNLFNNVHLFHLFLAELHYDHQVLLDYLISKDTGTFCAEYLLRCLRLVCDSWQLFVKFSVVGNSENQFSHNKRKYICVDESSMPLETNEVFTVLEKSYYKKAKECLIALLISVENLHQKKLFPYNPRVLLKRLRTFQELCCKEERHYRRDR